MNFDILTPVAIALIVLAGVTALLAIGVVVDFVARNHEVRVARHESIPTYYGSLLGAH